MKRDSADPLDVLLQEFLRRVRAGERLSPEEFAREHEGHEKDLRDILPTLLLLERVKKHEESASSGLGRPRIGSIERLGDYRIVREIGRGGMGVVFEAVQEALGRRVALKVLPQSHFLTGHQLERFQREARTAAGLHHSHIVPVFACGEADGYHYYAMQFIDGRGLDRWIAERAAERGADPALGEAEAVARRCREAASFCLDAAQALVYAHGQGTLHRDIKPSNLLLDGKGHVWITDFGLAKALESDGLTLSGDLLGTLQYMAPEQLRGVYDERSEICALGLTLFELIALEPARKGRTRSELIERIQDGRIDRLDRLDPRVPRDLVTIVGKATARDPADRYEGAAAFAEDLERFLQDRPIRARRHSAAELLWRWCKRHRALAALGSGLAAVTLLAAIGGWTLYGITSDALSRAEESALAAKQAEGRAEANLRLSLEAFEDVFDSLIGPDPFHAFEEDPSTGEYSGVVRTAVDPRVAALMQNLLEFYDRFAAANEHDAQLQEQTARAHRRVGDIRFRLGQVEQARTSFEQALRLYQDVHERDVHLEIAGLHLELAKVSLARDDPLEAQQRCEESLRALEDGPSSRKQRFVAAQAHVLSLWSLWWDGADLFLGLRADRPSPLGPLGPPRPRNWLSELKVHYEAAEKLLAELLAADPGNPDVLEQRARLLRFLARPRTRLLEGDVDPARSRDEALSILKGLVERFPQADHYRFELVDTLLLQSGFGRGMAKAEVERLRSAVEHARELVRQQPEIPAYRDILARAEARCGTLLVTSSPRDAAEMLAAALAYARARLSERPDDPRWRAESTVLRLAGARALLSIGEKADATLLAAELVDELLEIFDPDRPSGPPPEFAWVGRILGARRNASGQDLSRERNSVLRLLDDLGLKDERSDQLRRLLREGR